MEFKYVFGPVPSRRLGLSLGVSPIPKKTCNYSCVYCQLGRTDKMTDKRKNFYDCEEIVGELREYLKQNFAYDVITLVGEGEPTLYANLGNLIGEIKEISDKPVVVITNGALLYDSTVRKELCRADIVMPSMDYFDEESYKKVNRPCGVLRYDDVYDGLVKFSHEFGGTIWLEIMLVKGFNDGKEQIQKIKELLEKIKYDKVYVNTPVRPPAESYAKQVEDEAMEYAEKTLGGISISALASKGFFSEIADDYSAINSIIKRHPMNQHEIRAFLQGRNCENIDEIFTRLNGDEKIEKVNYKTYVTYRLK